MSIVIPIWLLWTLGILGGIIILFIITVILCFAWMGYQCANALGKGMNW